MDVSEARTGALGAPNVISLITGHSLYMVTVAAGGSTLWGGGVPPSCCRCTAVVGEEADMAITS